MVRIDTHQHFWTWDARSPILDIHAGSNVARDFGPDDLGPQLEAAGIAKTFVVQLDNDLDETEALLGTVAGCDFVAGAVGWLPLTRPGVVKALLDTQVAKGLIGVRHAPRSGQPVDWASPSVGSALEELAESAVVLEFLVTGHDGMRTVRAIAHRHPTLRISINHLANPFDFEDLDSWKDDVTASGQLDNVAIKLSFGYSTLPRALADPGTTRQVVNHVLDTFLPDRILAGSNWPVSLRQLSYPAIWQLIDELIASLPQDERARIVSVNARDWYRNARFDL
jgi:L-fuconolactonase